MVENKKINNNWISHYLFKVYTNLQKKGASPIDFSEDKGEECFTVGLPKNKDLRESILIYLFDNVSKDVYLRGKYLSISVRNKDEVFVFMPDCEII